MADVMGAPEGAVVKTDEEDSLGADLLKAIRADAAQSEEAAEPEATAETPDTEDETSAEDEGGEETPEAEAEGEEGPEAEVEAEAETEAEGDDLTEDQEDEGAEPERPAIVCPPSWSGQDREEFDKLTPETQEIISRREGERDEHLQTVTTERDSLSAHRTAFDQITAPYKHDMGLNGVSDLQFTNMLYEAHGLLRRDPTQGVLWLIEQYNGDAQKVVEGLSAKGKVNLDELDPLAEDELEPDPRVTRLEGELNALKGGVNQVGEYAKAAQAVAPLQKALETFQAKTSEDGKPAYPHYEQVRALMASFTANGDAVRAVAKEQGVPPAQVSDIGKVLDKAYSMALWASPETRGDLVNGQITEATEKSRKEVAKKAETDKARKAKAAKKAAVGVKSAGTQNSEAAGKEESLGDELRRRIQESSESTEATAA